MDPEPLAAEPGLTARYGLTSAEAVSRRAAAGPEVSAGANEEPLWREILESLTEPLVLLLVVVGVLYALLGEIRDAAIIFAVIVTVAAVETWTERRAGHAIAALSKMSAAVALTWRDGRLVELAPEQLVAGDVVLLTAGSRVPADGRLIESEQLLVDESLVTGESAPVAHGVADGAAGELLGGTHVVRGRALAVVTATGAASTLGRIALLVAGVEEQRTPLQNQMRGLARRLVVVALAVSVLVPAIAALRGQPWRQMLLTGLTLAFATIPEELPILVVIVLGLGSLRLARRGAIVRRLIAAETLGATTLVCTDKTGTLTENRMTLTAVLPASQAIGGVRGDAADDRRITRLAQLASELPVSDGSGFVDPMDAAIWAHGEKGTEASQRFTFDGERRLASGLVRADGRWMVGVKGAAEEVLQRSTSWQTGGRAHEVDAATRTHALEAVRTIAVEGSRVLAVASRSLPSLSGGNRDEVERDLRFEGLLVFADPLRPEVPRAVRELRRAGVAITMVTGDQPATAGAIGRAVGIQGEVFTSDELAGWSDHELAARATAGCIFARVRPEDKLRIVQVTQRAGQVVAVTGDGVNDAPALRAAAIGVAMGRGGTDVAREAADLVLTDDNFATLAAATGEGRRLYENLRKAVRYYLAIKLALIAVTLVAAISGGPLPFAPVQIVILELFMDLGASIAFVHQRAETDEMLRPPRNPKAPFLDRAMLTGILLGGLTLAILSGGAFLLARPELGVDSARTLALVAWLVGHVALGIVMGWERRPVSLRDLAANPAMLGWGASALAFSFAILAIPPLRSLLHAGAVPLLPAMLTVAAATLLPLWLEGLKRLVSPPFGVGHE